ncbi:Protein doublesex, partial [Frankliniella fusca]
MQGLAPRRATAALTSTGTGTDSGTHGSGVEGSQ